MQSKYSKSIILSSLFWKLLERGGTQSVQLIIQIILARMLAPEEFGMIAIVMVFINLAQVFVQSGFSTALIQKQNATEEDFSSIFYLSLVIAGILYIFIFLLAPFIAHFYNELVLIPILRVLALTLFTGAFNSIQNAYVSKNFLFKKLFKSSLASTILSGIVGIICAYQNMGIWALVIQQIVNQLSVTVIMWFTIKWKPMLFFSISKVRELFSFGWKLLASQLLNVFYMDLRILIIGRIYSSSTLAFYNRGQQFPNVIVSNIDGSIQSVMLPTLSAHQNNRQRVKEIMRRAIISSSFLVFPLMTGMAVVAEPLIKIVLTDSWLPSVPFLQIFCMTYALVPIHTANLQAINALGRSDIFLKLEVIKKISGLAILSFSLPFGIYAIALGQVLSGLISSFINAYPNKKLLNYSYSEQWTDIKPSLLISLFMGGIVYSFNYLRLPLWFILILQIVSGSVIYMSMAKIFKIESFNYLMVTFKQFINLRKEVSS